MARQTTVTLVDDLDGSEAEEQVEFSVDGRTLRNRPLGGQCPEIARRARAVRYRGPPHGRQRAAAARWAAVPSRSDRAQNPAIREWAIAQGMKVSERGRIPTNVLTGFHSAH